MSIPKKYGQFNNREERAAFIAETFRSELATSSSVLDVGCDINTLKKIVGSKVTGIDLYGEPDFRVDLEKEKLSRFRDSEFDFIVCTEVLEHLEDFHAMVDELFRVSAKYVLISLPNSLDLFTRIRILFLGDAGKFYGLPFEKPEDRHRWLFSHKAIDRFFTEYSRKKGPQIDRKFLQCNFSNSWKGVLVRNAIRIFNIDAAAQSYWILLKKKESL